MAEKKKEFRYMVLVNGVHQDEKDFPSLTEAKKAVEEMALEITDHVQIVLHVADAIRVSSFDWS